MARSVAYVVHGEKATRYKVPATLTREQVSFDRGAEFAPGAYHLSRVNPSSRQGADRSRVIRRVKSAINSKVGGHRYPETKHRHVTENVRTVLGAK
jgi:hypothetical protein